MKKIISLFLALLMLVSLMIACDDSNVNDVESNGENVETKNEETTASDTVVMKEYDLTNFCIIFNNSTGADNAFSFQAKVKALTGVELNVRRDVAGNNEFEFIFGHSERDVSKRFYVDEYDTYYNQKGLLNDNGKMQVLGVDQLTLGYSVDYICEKILTENQTTFTVFDNGATAEEITMESISLPERADSSYLRIVSNNIFLQRLNSNAERLNGLRSAFKYYDADIFGLQEVDDLWHINAKLDETMAELGYSMVPIKPTDSRYASLKDSDIRNPIYYKTDKFELIDCGYDRYAATEFDNGEYPSSSYTWACLELKDSGKRLIVFSTHFVAKINHQGATAAQSGKSISTYHSESAKELLDVIAELGTEYPNVPVIAVGDYNSNYEGSVHGRICSKLFSARTRAEKKVNMNYHSSGNPLGGEPPIGKAIDHIFFSKSGITAKHFETLVSPYSYAYSDHVPVLMDFVLT